jgi:hypothetical protein
MCEVYATVNGLFQQMKIKILDTIQDLFGGIPEISGIIDKITDPLTLRYVNLSALTQFPLLTCIFQYF